jgi:hypothetical protein
VAAKRILDREHRSAMRYPFLRRLGRKHDKLSAGELEASFFIVDKRRFCPPSFHPHSSVSMLRSVHIGRSRFSGCCHLTNDL